MAEISAKDFGKAKYRSGGRSRGRGGRHYHAGRQQQQNQGAWQRSNNGEGEEEEEEEEEEGHEDAEHSTDAMQRGAGSQAPIGPRSQSQGADLTSLLADAQHYYGQAYYRRLALQEEVQEQAGGPALPDLASQAYEQDLVVDLPSLAACLSALPLHELLGLEPEYCQELQQQQLQQPQQQQQQQRQLPQHGQSSMRLEQRSGLPAGQQQQAQQPASANSALPAHPPTPSVTKPAMSAKPAGPGQASLPVSATASAPVPQHKSGHMPPALSPLAHKPSAPGPNSTSEAADAGLLDDLDNLLLGRQPGRRPVAQTPTSTSVHGAAASTAPGASAGTFNSAISRGGTAAVTAAASGVGRPAVSPPVPSAAAPASTSVAARPGPASSSASGLEDDELDELLCMVVPQQGSNTPAAGHSSASSAAIPNTRAAVGSGGPATAKVAVLPPQRPTTAAAAPAASKTIQSFESWLDEL